MQLRQFGRTGRVVSRIGLGLAALGRPAYINLGHHEDLRGNTDPDALCLSTHTILDAAYSAGVRYFDAARSYGRAEEFLAAWLNQRSPDPDSVTIASKWGYTYTAGWQIEADKHEIKDHSADNFRKQFAETRQLLGGYLRIYQTHSVTPESGLLDNEEALRELVRLRDSGIAVGLSLSGVTQAQTLRRAMTINFGGPVFSVVQATWNLLEPSIGPVLAEAHAAGYGIVIKEALANGRLTIRNTADDFAERRAILNQIADTHNTTLDAIALAGVLAQPWADVVLSGAATPMQLRSNLQALQVTLTSEQLEQLTGLAEPTQEYWDRRSQLRWN